MKIIYAISALQPRGSGCDAHSRIALRDMEAGIGPRRQGIAHPPGRAADFAPVLGVTPVLQRR